MPSCTSGSLRLYEGENENEGNLQICTNVTWWQVISYNWDSLDGEVACRQLGLLHSGGTSELKCHDIIFLINIWKVFWCLYQY